MELAVLMISELSAGCECRLFGTGLVMSENASDCTQNAAYRDRKLKDFLGRGAQPPPQTPQTPPHWRGEHLLPKRHPVARYSHLRRSTCCPSTFIICPPISHFWLRAWVGGKFRKVTCAQLHNVTWRQNGFT